MFRLFKNVTRLIQFLLLCLLVVWSSPPVLASIYQQLQWPWYVPANSDVCSYDSADGLSSFNIPEPHKTIFNQAANAYKTNVSLLAAIFLSENENIWKPIDNQWASSDKGASGPMQFMPGTWEGYKVDGNNDGSIDINNFYDAVFSAANLISSYNARPNSELGSLEQPLKTNTLLQISASYNAGPGAVQQWGSSAPLSALYQETREYLSNVYSLITSGFTKSGKPGYGDPSGLGGGTGSLVSGCSSGVFAGSIVQTTIGLAWPKGDHGPNKQDATAAYQQALTKYNGSTGEGEWSDCGVFVATVMIASGTDTNYPKRGTPNQADYVKSSPKYTVTKAQDTSQLQPGDILIYNGPDGGHTFIFVGMQTDFEGDSAAASLDGHVPQATSAAGSFAYKDRGVSGNYLVARLK